MKKKIPLRALIEVAISAAMAMVLDLLPSIKLSPSISISFAMVPIFIIAFRWGVRAAVVSGFLWGVLQILTGDAYILTPLQGLIEYFLAFSFIGSAGLLAPSIQKAIAIGNKGKLLTLIVFASFLGSLTRYFWHFIAGVIFFANYAHEAGKTPIVFSFMMNGITMIFTFILCSIVLMLIISIRPQLLLTEKR